MRPPIARSRTGCRDRSPCIRCGRSGCVGQVGGAVERDEIDAVGRQAADALHQRLLDEPLLEDRGCPRRVDRAPHPRVADRPIVVVLHVVLAAPHHLHRLADRLRRLDRVHDEVGFAATAEPAAHVGDVDLHLVRGHPRAPIAAWCDASALRRHVDVAAVGADVGGAVHRLHARVREERRLAPRSNARGPASAWSALPSLRATLPGCCASSVVLHDLGARQRASGPSSHVTSSACAPAADQ